jgi:hypothetical protein
MEDNMRERNGIAVFEVGEDHPDHPAFRELRSISLGDVRFPFGFFIVDEDGQRYVRPATEEERKELLFKVFPDGPSETVLDSNFCYLHDGKCVAHLCAQIEPPSRCFRGYDESRRQYGCWCESIW